MADIFVRLHSGRLMVVVLDRFVVIVFEPGDGRGSDGQRTVTYMQL
jgi:hypothetical protein